MKREIKELAWHELKYFSKITHETDKKDTTKKDTIKEDTAQQGVENNTPNKNVNKELIGQKRAAEALSFGLQMKTKGYNIYVCGATGTGRTTFTNVYAKEKAIKEPVPPDLCYVYNFANPKCPQLLRVPAGQGRILHESMEDLIDRLSMELPKLFADKDYIQKKEEITKVLQVKRDEIIKEVSEEARKYDFEVKNSPTGIYFLPVIDGEVISEEQFDSLSSEQRDTITKKSESISQCATEALRAIKTYEKNTKKEVEELDYTLGLFTVGHHMDDMIKTFGNEPNVLEYLKAVKEDILDNLGDFISEDDNEEDALQAFMPWANKKSTDDILTKYKINILTDNSELTGAPVILDYNPSYSNLVGEIEYDNEFGNFSTDFMKIKPGLLHKSNGGYLILQAQDVLGNHHAWETLKRVLITGKLAIEPLREYTTGVAVSGIKPEPIPIDVKIILIGGGFYYDILYYYDDYFEKLFKIRVDFDYEMHMNEKNVQEITNFVKHYCEETNSIPLDLKAINKLVEHATRLAERQDRLTTRFNRLTEILAESIAWAEMDNAKIVTETHVQKAISKREYRLNMYEEKLSEMIEDDIIMLSTDGAKVGQINGLAVLDTGDHVFAKPSRITATTYMGKSGIVNIEKEADMSGSIHEKGVEVLKGYLGQTYAQEFPLSLSCRICFEQNYNGIDGDSASSTELIAVLSSLSGLPIRQNIAITGSINQHGEIQPIGGATYKIEGFFDLCKKRGLTGKQGVVIPTRNTRDLVLNDEVIEAVKNGTFHIYPVSHINEAIEIMLDTPAGEWPFPFDTVHGKVFRRLRSYHRKTKE